MHHNIIDSLINMHYEKVYQVICLMFKDKTLSEDACQEAFYEAIKNIKKLNDISMFRPWVLKIAIRKASHLVKKSSKMELTDMIDNEKDISINVEQEALTKELQSETQELIKELDFPYRQVVVLKYHYDMQDKDIANFLDIPIGTVKSRLYRAKNIIKKKIMTANRRQGVRK